jgi:hypothetical protein
MIHLQVISERFFDIWSAATFFWLLSSIVVNPVVVDFFVQQCQFIYHIATFTRMSPGKV